LSNLTLISPLWRHLVQQRIYRHSRFKVPSNKLVLTIFFVQSRSRARRTD
jgi:hypothetical protein